jgi:Phage portal protein
MARGSVLPAITRCTSIIVESVVRTRWLYRDAQGNVLPRPLWVDDPMLLGKAPGPIFPLQPAGRRMDGHSFFSSVLADAILFGQGGFVFIESSDGSPLPGSLQLLNPMMFAVDETGHIILDPFGRAPLRTDFDGRFQLAGQTWRVARLPGMYPNHEGWPQGVLLRHFATFQVGAKLGRYLDGIFETGVPSGYLSVSQPNFGAVPVPDPDNPGELMKEADLLKRDWMKAHGRGRRSVAVLNSLVTYTPLSINPVDADVAKIASVSRTDIAHAFGMSSVWLDEGMSGLNYSNSSERRADLVNLTSAGWGEKLTMMISSLLPYGTEVSVNWPTFVQPSSETLMPAMVAAVQAEILSPTEARQYLGMVPWSGPDTRFEAYLATQEFGASSVAEQTPQNDDTTEEVDQ